MAAFSPWWFLLPFAVAASCGWLALAPGEHIDRVAAWLYRLRAPRRAATLGRSALTTVKDASQD